MPHPSLVAVLATLPIMLAGCGGAEPLDADPPGLDSVTSPVEPVETARGPALAATGDDQSGAAIAMLGYCNIPVDTTLLDILSTLPVPVDAETGAYLFNPPQDCAP